jgi:hypothetical protein
MHSCARHAQSRGRKPLDPVGDPVQVLGDLQCAATVCSSFFSSVTGISGGARPSRPSAASALTAIQIDRLDPSYSPSTNTQALATR